MNQGIYGEHGKRFSSRQPPVCSCSFRVVHAVSAHRPGTDRGGGDGDGEASLEALRAGVDHSATDGRHSAVGRATDPTDVEIAGYEAKMAAQCIAGWLAIAEGDYFARRSRMNLLMVKPLGNPGDGLRRPLPPTKRSGQANSYFAGI